jgi:hypothetical protein
MDLEVFTNCQGAEEIPGVQGKLLVGKMTL